MDLQRSFSLYLNGELESSKVKRIEDHLLDCGPCRTSLARLRSGHRFAGQIPRFNPQRDPWSAIEAAIEKEQALAAAASSSGARAFASWRRQPAFAVAVAAVLIAALSVFGISLWREQEIRGLMDLEAFDTREFQTVSISNIESNTKPHIVAEGYVSQVGVNDEDGDFSFKIVDNLQQPEPFIVCEIIDPIRFAPPKVGSRVRVYGVSRYDSQRNHNWYEVHPVLNIEVVR
jgi:putative zinc finger protein